MELSWTAARSVTTGAAPAMVQVESCPTLRELALEARTDARASTALMKQVREMALRYARVRLGRFGAEDTAQDVAQEVCMAVLNGLRTYEDRGLPFEAFVYSITARRVADAQRAALRGPAMTPEVPDQVSQQPTPEEAAVVRDEADLALALLRELPEQQQEIIMLRVVVGMSADETGAALGMTAGAVRVAQHRALGKLRTRMTATAGHDAAPGGS